MDWVLALAGPDNVLIEFVAVEVQSIDTTGNYRAERLTYLNNKPAGVNSVAGINWENVNKRILPKLIFKGHVLRLEPLCRSGLFFVCPAPVLARIYQRVGHALREYPSRHPGTITFRSYDPGELVSEASVRPLELRAELTTTVDQLAHAFTAPVNLPKQGSYAEAIERKLKRVSENLDG